MITVFTNEIGHIEGILHNLNEVVIDGNIVGAFNTIQIANNNYYEDGSACLRSVEITRSEFLEIIKKHCM